MPILKISPSLLSANFAKLGEEVKNITEAGADAIHIDVMDGHFVPNLTFGPVVLESIRSYSTLPFDVHLMITPVDLLIPAFINAGSDIITFHIEATENIPHTLSLIKNSHAKIGLSLKPHTPHDMLDPYYALIDSILVMTVEPGFGGQSFMENQLEKIKAIRRKIDLSGRSIELEVDGGITPHTAPLVYKAGASMAVAGSAVFKTGLSYKESIENLKFSRYNHF